MLHSILKPRPMDGDPLLKVSCIHSNVMKILNPNSLFFTNSKHLLLPEQSLQCHGSCGEVQRDGGEIMKIVISKRMNRI